MKNNYTRQRQGRDFSLLDEVNHLRNAEHSIEGNYNQIDGILGNAPPKDDFLRPRQCLNSWSISRRRPSGTLRLWTGMTRRRKGGYSALDKDLSAAISEIMPLVEIGDKTKPFIITQNDGYGYWQVTARQHMGAVTKTNYSVQVLTVRSHRLF